MFNMQADPDRPGYVTPYAINHLLTYVEKEGLDFKTYYKDEGYPWVYWKMLYFLVCFWDKLSPGFLEHFNTRVSNASSKEILFPSRETHGDWTKINVYSTLRHELVHIRDARRFPILFQLSYTLLPLPALFAYCRADWEFRGYAQNMIASYNHHGVIEDSQIEFIVSKFSGSLYFWMFPFTKTMRRKVKALAKDIEEGTVYGYYPKIHIWQY